MTNKTAKYELMLQKKRTQFIDNFWLNLGDTSEIKTGNPFHTDNELEKSNPLMHIVNVMRQPENFSFTCKHLFGINIHPFQAVILKVIWQKPFPMLIGSRGMSKSFILALYALLKAIFVQGSKVVFVGSAFRQAKVIFEYCERIFRESPMLQNILANDTKLNRPTRNIDRCEFRIGSSIIYGLPCGDGTKIRGMRCTDLLSDEFNSINVNIYEHIMRGFGAVSATPMDNVVQIARIEALKELGEITGEIALEEQKRVIKSNKSIISGTTGYEFDSFCKYWKRYKAIIESRGNLNKVHEIFNGEIPLGFDHKDYAIIRIPYDIIPRGFMDEKQIGQGQATMSKSMFWMEFGSVFIKDSEGFFRRSLIERCIAKSENKINLESCGLVNFSCVLKGEPKRKYVMAIDTASEKDNFAISILELWPDHRRVVYSWTINREKHKARLHKGLAEDHDYYKYGVRKIRELMRNFNIEAIAMDAMGGGITIEEILGDPAQCKAGEKPIYQIIEEDVKKHTDDLPGLHILHMIYFSDAMWTNEANHLLRKDMEKQALLFPDIDAADIAISWEESKLSGAIKADLVEDESFDLLYDTLELCMLDIEEMKEELTTIVHTKTTNGRDRWDTPEIKTLSGKKSHLLKDRYTALLMANWVADKVAKEVAPPQYEPCGGIAQHIGRTKKKIEGNLYNAPPWFMEKMKNTSYGTAVIRKK